jgi:hypothetical protein
VLTETILKNATIDVLLELMVERIHHQKSLHAKYDSNEYKALKAEIQLLQKEIDKRKNQDVVRQPPPGPGSSPQL